MLAGAFSPGDGHATPEGVVQGYAFAARAHGAHIRVGCEVPGSRPSAVRSPTSSPTDGVDPDTPP